MTCLTFCKVHYGKRNVCYAKLNMVNGELRDNRWFMFFVYHHDESQWTTWRQLIFVICYLVVSYLLIMFAVSFKIMSHVITCYVDAAMLTFVWQVVGGMATCSCYEMLWDVWDVHVCMWREMYVMQDATKSCMWREMYVMQDATKSCI